MHSILLNLTYRHNFLHWHSEQPLNQLACVWTVAGRRRTRTRVEHPNSTRRRTFNFKRYKRTCWGATRVRCETRFKETAGRNQNKRLFPGKVSNVDPNGMNEKVCASTYVHEPEHTHTAPWAATDSTSNTVWLHSKLTVFVIRLTVCVCTTCNPTPEPHPIPPSIHALRSAPRVCSRDLCVSPEAVNHEARRRGAAEPAQLRLKGSREQWDGKQEQQGVGKAHPETLSWYTWGAIEREKKKRAFGSSFLFHVLLVGQKENGKISCEINSFGKLIKE